MSTVSHASALLNALASPARLSLLSAVAQNPGRTLTQLGEDLGVPLKALVKDVSRLQECGLLRVSEDRRVTADLGVLSARADALVATLPIDELLSGAPELRRYFVNGRLTELAVDHTVKLKLAPLLARLVPEDRALSEAELNEVLNQVHDDHAYLRRMLVDFGQLSRDPQRMVYRRAG